MDLNLGKKSRHYHKYINLGPPASFKNNSLCFLCALELYCPATDSHGKSNRKREIRNFSSFKSEKRCWEKKYMPDSKIICVTFFEPITEENKLLQIQIMDMIKCVLH